MFLTRPSRASTSTSARHSAPVGCTASYLVEIAMLATSLGLVVPVLTDAVVLHHPLGVLTVACASAV